MHFWGPLGRPNSIFWGPLGRPKSIFLGPFATQCQILKIAYALKSASNLIFEKKLLKHFLKKIIFWPRAVQGLRNPFQNIKLDLHFSLAFRKYKGQGGQGPHFGDFRGGAFLGDIQIDLPIYLYYCVYLNTVMNSILFPAKWKKNQIMHASSSNK